MRHSRWRLGMAFVVALTLALPLTAAAGTESEKASPVIGRDFRISGNDAVEWEDYSAVARNETEGEYLVVWEDSRTDGGASGDIRGRLVGDDGQAAGGDTRISGPGATSYDACPDVAWSATSNEYLVVWQDGRLASTKSTEIYGRLVGADGKPDGPDFQISAPGLSDSDNCPAVAWTPQSDRFLVVWESNYESWYHESEIRGRLVSADGKVVGTAPFLISGAGAVEDDRSAAVAYSATSNQFLVVWEDYRNQATSACDVYGRRVTAAGVPTGSDFRVSGSTGYTDQALPEVAWNGSSNQYLVVYEDSRGDGGSRGFDIYGRLVAGGGGTVGGEKRISGGKATSEEKTPEVAWDGATGGYLVVWQDWRAVEGGGSTDIRGQMLGVDALRIGGDFRVSGAMGVLTEQHPDLAYGSDPLQFLVVWTDRRNFTERRDDIYGRRVQG